MRRPPPNESKSAPAAGPDVSAAGDRLPAAAYERVERLPAAAYERAERLLGHHRARLALRSRVQPNWIGDGRRFWYRVETRRGSEFVLVDVAARSRRPAFDHERLARSLASRSEREVDPYALPFETIEVGEDEIAFTAFGRHWTFRLSDYLCRSDGVPAPASPVESPSPDGRWVAFRRGHDLWLRATSGGDEFALTVDGTADRPYATNPDFGRQRQMLKAIGVFESPVRLLWSPDSRRILTYRLDQRGVGWSHLVEAAPADGGRPRLHRYRYPLPGETRPTAGWLIIDVGTRLVVPVRAAPFPWPYRAPIASGQAWWSADGARVYYLDQPRDLRTLRLNSVDAATGEVRTLIEETGDTRVEPSQDSAQPPMVRVLSGGDEVLWYSQRDGRGHLYRYDLPPERPSVAPGDTGAGGLVETGGLVEAGGTVETGGTGGAAPVPAARVVQVTEGAYCVQRIAHVDESARVAYLVVSGLVTGDPYRRTLVSVDLDGGGLTRLTGDDLDHVVTVPPHGDWFVDSASTVDTPPVITVRGRDASVLVELERADVTPLREAGWSAPERFQAVAADGETLVYGVLYKPYGFDPAQRYPVVDHPYPGPQTSRVQPCFDAGWYGYDAEAVAALGFVVVALDGRGTPGRDKAFHDHAYRNMGSAGGIEDHVAALRQLGASRPWMDLDRVGVFGLSGGGFAAVRAMLTHPEVYKVGVAEAGNHDNRQFTATWAETYDGPFGAGARDLGHRDGSGHGGDPATGGDSGTGREPGTGGDPATGSRLSNTELAANLTGRLLLVHGEMDEGVHPYLTLRLVDRLIAAGKDFDLLLVPGAEHLFIGYQDYVTRRRWDHLVRHLLNREPPAYRLAPIPLLPELRAFILGG